MSFSIIAGRKITREGGDKYSLFYETESITGVGVIFVWGGELNLGAHRGPKMVEGGPNNHNLAWLYRTNSLGPYFFQLLVLIKSN